MTVFTEEEFAEVLKNPDVKIEGSGNNAKCPANNDKCPQTRARKGITMQSNTCPQVEMCIAPICPLDNSFYRGAVWYADEPICTARQFRREKWRINQRKILKVQAKRPVEGYFSVEYLQNLGRVTQVVKGIMPDSRREQNVMAKGKA